MKLNIIMQFFIGIVIGFGLFVSTVLILFIFGSIIIAGIVIYRKLTNFKKSNKFCSNDDDCSLFDDLPTVNRIKKNLDNNQKFDYYDGDGQCNN